MTLLDQLCDLLGPPRTELTIERSISFLLFEIKRVFVYNSTIFKLTDLFILYFFIQNVHANKKVFKKKGYKIMYKVSNCDRKSQLSEILIFIHSYIYSTTKHEILQITNHNLQCRFDPPNQGWLF